jgi:RNA polymerase sigma-70 factor (ECF subfamily)
LLDEETLVALVGRAQRGDAAAFSALARAFMRAAYAVSLSIVGRPSDAEDVAQDAFVQALEHIESCREPRRFAGWLLQIVRNQSKNWLERRRLRDVPATADTPNERMQTAEVTWGDVGLRGRLGIALDVLTTTQRQVVMLHDVEEWTHAEIADSLSMSEVMSRQHLFNARRALRKALADTQDAATPQTRTQHG